MNNIDSSKIRVSGLFDSDNIISLPGFSMTLVEEIGVSLPTLKLTFKLEHLYNVLKYVIIGAKVTVHEADKSYVFEVLHYHMLDEKTIEITCLLDKLDFITKARQKAEEGTSVEVLKSIESLECVYLTDRVAPDDKQIWVQDNIDDRDFAVQVLLHSYIKDDFLVYYVSKEGKFNIASYAELIKKNTLEMGADKSDVGVHEIIAEALPAGYRLSTLSSQGSYNQLLSLDSPIGDNTQAPESSFRVFFDCGNTHPRYNQAYDQINTKYSNLFKALFTLISRNQKPVNPLDVLKISYYPTVYSTSNAPSILNKNFLVTKVSTNLSQGVVTRQIWFAKLD